MSILKVIYTNFGIWKMKKNEKKERITHPTTESQPLLTKWWISFQSFLILQSLGLIILFDIVTIVLINSAYLKTKTHSTRCHMAQCAELLNKF